MAVAVGMKTWEVPFPSFFGQIVPQVRILSHFALLASG